MRIGIIDADLIGRKRHRFPNLACMKISGYYKEMGNDVKLLLNYENLDKYDKIYISKVFTDVIVDKNVLELPNVEYGGTGFFYDKAKPLPYEIEHHMPDYHLYDEWIEEKIKKGENIKNFDCYLNYSIGFTTRGCFRQCPFCVNRNYKKVVKHSPLEEFLDKDRKYICLLDDNILGYSGWEEVFDELNKSGKRFQFKQGMDERILTEKKCKTILTSNYVGDYMFAFDNIEDKEIIIKKLELWKEIKDKLNNKKNTKFYVFCGFDRKGNYDEEFWKQDIIDTFERIRILSHYGCLPYIMRYKDYEKSPYKGTYINLASWCNQPSFFKKKSYREYCMADQLRKSTDKICATLRYLIQLEEKYPEIASEYFDFKYKD